MQTSGLDLAARFFEAAVAPIVDRVLGSRDGYAAALIGAGSEVLGLDTERSRDHDWGPRCQVFPDGPLLDRSALLDDTLAAELPASFAGFPTGFSAADGDDRGSAGGPGELRHRVEVLDLDIWWRAQTGGSPHEPLGVEGWLALPTQRLAELTGGAVFHDRPGRLTAARAGIGWFPDDVWRYVLACGWRRIAEEQPFVGRCAEVGDEQGSRLVAAGIVRELMRLWLLLDRRYPPYSKWLGSAFAASARVGPLAADLLAATRADDIATREAALVRALVAVIERQNGSGLARQVSTEPRYFFSRPFLVVDADDAAAALLASIHDVDLVGRRARSAIDSVTDNIAVTGDIALTQRIVEVVRTADGTRP